MCSLTAISRDGHRVILRNEELAFGYRYSNVRNKGYIITEAVLLLERKDKEDINRTIQELLSRRRESQPLEFRSAGSIFKNPSGAFAGE